jgi:hypothetical protein
MVKAGLAKRSLAEIIWKAGLVTKSYALRMGSTLDQIMASLDLVYWYAVDE